MKKFTRILLIAVVLACCLFLLSSCYDEPDSHTNTDKRATKEIADNLSGNQPTPTDIDFSLERYNLTRRAYWVNGMHEKANTLICRVEKPLGYIVLFAGNTIVGRFVVDGKVSSLNSYLTPDSDYYEVCYNGTANYYKNEWLADVDGSYGENDNGIFFFTPNGNYIECTGEYPYSDIPFEVETPVVKYEVK